MDQENAKFHLDLKMIKVQGVSEVLHIRFSSISQKVYIAT